MRNRILTEDLTLISSQDLQAHDDDDSSEVHIDVESCRSYQSKFEETKESSFAAACKQ